jgi:type III pantothenate kinase
MNLIIDIGNTKTKIAVFEGRVMVHLKALFSFQVNDLEEIFRDFSIQTYFLSSVKNEDELILNYLDSNCKSGEVFNSITPLPFKIDYETPNTLGLDRIALAAAAFCKYPSMNILVISCGTCITYNLISGEGVFNGGGISPGVHMRLKAMQHFTDKLPLAEWNGRLIPQLIAKNTNEALLSGAVNGALCELTEVINRYRQTFTRELNIILSGGDAKFFEKELKNSIFADSNFVLYGLNEIHHYNS